MQSLEKLQQQAQRPMPKLITGNQAVKAVLQQNGHPSILFVSTHGVFAPADTRQPDTDNPLVRCALLFAGCNDPKVREQGVLTGLEIVRSDLRGCELVVLSACQTGLGDVRDGEGVAGMRQCFQLAGAQCVVATLWNVPDLETAKQTVSFLQLLTEGNDMAKALALAQRKHIQELRDEGFNGENPLFWAAITITGAANQRARLGKGAQ